MLHGFDFWQNVLWENVCKYFPGHPVPPWPDGGVLLYSAAIARPDWTWWLKLELRTGKVGICSNNSRVSNCGLIWSKHGWDIPRQYASLQGYTVRILLSAFCKRLVHDAETCIVWSPRAKSTPAEAMGKGKANDNDVYATYPCLSAMMSKLLWVCLFHLH